MKTLDEVIKGVEAYAKLFEEKGCFECHYREDDCVKSCFLQDALHYLKEYRKQMSDPDGDHQQLIKCQALLQDFYRNEPLTWDELKSMVGKPVWVEMEGYKPNLGIVMNQDKRNGRLLLCGYDKVAIRIEINEEGEGKTWQAYRKERK